MERVSEITIDWNGWNLPADWVWASSCLVAGVDYEEVRPRSKFVPSNESPTLAEALAKVESQIRAYLANQADTPIVIEKTS